MCPLAASASEMDRGNPIFVVTRAVHAGTLERAMSGTPVDNVGSPLGGAVRRGAVRRSPEIDRYRIVRFDAGKLRNKRQAQPSDDDTAPAACTAKITSTQRSRSATIMHMCSATKPPREDRKRILDDSACRRSRHYKNPIISPSCPIRTAVACSRTTFALPIRPIAAALFGSARSILTLPVRSSIPS
jgi:hypothetical protein